MNKIKKIDELLSDDSKLENYLHHLEKQDVCVPKNLNHQILLKIHRQNKKYYMNICKIAACLILGLVICRTDFITNDNFEVFTKKESQTLSYDTKFQEKFSDICGFLKTPLEKRKDIDEK